MDKTLIASIVGGVAGALTMFNMFPQYVKVLKTKQTDDLSKATFISISCSSFLWIIYGIMKYDAIIILANTPVFFFCVSILFMKIKYG